MKPLYPLKDVKLRVQNNLCEFSNGALFNANRFYGWGPKEMKKCLLRLNDRYYSSNPQMNHFHKTDNRKNAPLVKMDFYKMENAPEGNNVYTHLYIHPDSNMLIVDSFKEI